MSSQHYSKDSHYITSEQPPGSLNFHQPQVFNDSVASQSFMQKKESEKRKERLLQVRKQEQDRTRVNLTMKAKAEQEQQEEEMLEEKKRIYLEKKKLLEELQLQRDISLREIGQAHRGAEKAAEDQRIDEIKNQNHQNSFNEFMREKNKEAWDWQQKLEQERNAAMTGFVERKRKVLEDETNRTRSVVEEYRDKIKNQSIPEKEYHDYEEYDKTIHRKNFYAKANIDYSSSHLHNPLVVSHRNDETAVTAIQAAEKENLETTKRMETANTSRDISFKKSVERGSKAYEKERNKQTLSEINQQLEKIGKMENVKRISEGKHQPELLTKPAKKLTTDTRKDKLAEMDFEDAFAPKPVKKTLADQTKTRTSTLKKKDKPQPKSNQKTSAKKEPQHQQVIAEENENGEESDSEREKEQRVPSRQKDVSPQRQERSQERAQEQVSGKKSPSYYEDELSESYVSQNEASKDSGPQYFQNTFSQPADTRQQSNSSQFHQQQPQFATPELAEFQARYLPDKQNGSDDYQGPSSQQFYTHQPQPPVINEHMQHYQPDTGVNYWPYRSTDLGPIAEQHRPYQQSSQYSSDGEFQSHSRNQSAGTSDAPLEFDSNSIKNYIKEQEEFLKRLDDQKKKLREKIFEEEEKIVTSNKKSKSPEQKKENVPQRGYREAEEETSYERGRGDRSSPEKFDQSGDSEQLRQLKKRADDLLSKFMNPDASRSPKKDEARYSPKYDKYEAQRGVREDSHKPTRRRSPIKETKAYPDQDSTKRGRTPEKSAQKTVTFYGVGSSPSELDYSVSDHGWSDKKHKRGILKGEHKTVEQAPVENRLPKSEAFDISWGEPGKKNQTLAEAFKANRRDLVDKFEQEKSEHEKSAAVKPHKNVQRTKEEILRQRKEMMEYKAPKIVRPESSQSGFERSPKEPGAVSMDNDLKSKGKDPATDLLDRLAFGKKTKVNKKDMYELTSKNFDQLPEIKKRKEEEKRKEEFKARKEKAKQLDQKIRTGTSKAK